jgi:hypothetical protein
MTTLIDVDIDNWEGTFPARHDLVIHERGENPEDGMVLYGFDEIGLFDHEFSKPAYSFVPDTLEDN